MSDLQYDQERNTFSPVLAVGVLAAYLFSPNIIPTSSESSQAFALDRTSSTFNTTIFGKDSYSPNEFEQEIGDFYARLLKKQEPLGAEFEKVLYENLWDLYER